MGWEMTQGEWDNHGSGTASGDLEVGKSFTTAFNSKVQADEAGELAAAGDWATKYEGATFSATEPTAVTSADVAETTAPAAATPAATTSSAHMLMSTLGTVMTLVMSRLLI